MPEDERSSEPADSMEMWEQWYETASNVWKRSMDGGKETFVDPFGLYGAWLKSAGEAQQQLLTSMTMMLGSQEAWQRWLETTTEAWRRAAENAADPTGLIALWLEMMDETRAKLSTGSPLPSDPITFLKQWYDATSETLSKVTRDSIGTDAFMQSASQFMESYSSFTRTFRRASEEYFGNLQLSTHSDIARVAQLVINLEEKVDKLDVAVEDGRAQATTKTNAAIASVTARLDGVEHSLETLPGVLQKVEEKVDRLEAAIEKSASIQTQATTKTNAAIASVTARLDGVEHSLETLPGVLQKLVSAENLQKRLDSVEGKLETLLSAMENLAARETTPVPKPANSRRKTQASGNGSARRKANQVKDKA